MAKAEQTTAASGTGRRAGRKQTRKAKAPKAGTKRTVLVILSNRFSPSAPARFLEVVCKSDGTILQEKRLRARPAQPRFDEVWENDEGKQSLSSCTRIKRKYRHPLEKPRNSQG